MFKYFFKLPLIFIISILIFVTPIFAKNDNGQEIIKKYEEYQRQIAAEIQKTQVQIMVETPYREGRIGRKWGSGTVIAKKIISEGVVYFIYTAPHIVANIEKLLLDYKEVGIKIYILGKNNRQIEVEVVAWNWVVAALLLKAEIPKDYLDDFKFKVAEIAHRLPVSSIEEKFSNKLADVVYLGGYPSRELADSKAKVSRYVCNETIIYSSYSFMLIKTMHLPGKGGLVGPGQSGGGVFMVNEKTDRPEWVGTVTLGFVDGRLLTIGVSVDVIVERFLKQIPELQNLIKFPVFKLPPFLAFSQTVFYRDNKN